MKKAIKIASFKRKCKRKGWNYDDYQLVHYKDDLYYFKPKYETKPEPNTHPLAKYIIPYDELKKRKKNRYYFAQLLLKDIVYFENRNIKFSFDGLIISAIRNYGMNKLYIYWDDIYDIIEDAKIISPNYNLFEEDY